jgi:uncharacterized protein YqgV (UPF0045/DUF77 family)
MVTADLQVLPRPSTNDPENPYAIVDEAIKIIQASGLKYRVGPLGTAVQGELNEVLALIPKMTEAMRSAGAEEIITIVKIADLGDKSSDPITTKEKWNNTL